MSAPSVPLAPELEAVWQERHVRYRQRVRGRLPNQQLTVLKAGIVFRGRSPDIRGRAIYRLLETRRSGILALSSIKQAQANSMSTNVHDCTESTHDQTETAWAGQRRFMNGRLATESERARPNRQMGNRKMTALSEHEIWSDGQEDGLEDEQQSTRQQSK